MITAKIHFKTAMTGVRAEDVLDGYNPLGKWDAVAEDAVETIVSTDSGGVATVDIYGSDSSSRKYYRRFRLSHGDICDFPQQDPGLQEEHVVKA